MVLRGITWTWGLVPLASAFQNLRGVNQIKKMNDLPKHIGILHFFLTTTAAAIIQSHSDPEYAHSFTWTDVNATWIFLMNSFLTPMP